MQCPEETKGDLLTEIIRSGAHQILVHALEVEMSEFLETYRDLRTSDGRQRIVRNGFLPAQEVHTGVGSVEARVPRVRDRSSGDDSIRFHSKILPPYLRRTKSIEELLPGLYLKGISTGDFEDALESLLREDAPGLSASTIGRLKKVWEADYDAWRRRDLSWAEYVYIWADRVYCQARMEDQKQCLLALMGSTPTGEKELIVVLDGYRESEQSWHELLVDLKHRGLKMAPKQAVGDGALGFWKALRKVVPETGDQRCWVHETANVLNRLLKSLHAKAKDALHAMWMAPMREEAQIAMDAFEKSYGAEYPKAVTGLTRNCALLAFYDFPAEHWKHVCTSDPIESTFATVRLRTAKTRGCLSRTTALTMVFQLCGSAQKRWRKLDGYPFLAKVIDGARFVDSMEEEAAA